MKNSLLATCVLLTVGSMDSRGATPVLSDLRVQQKIEAAAHLYKVTPALQISFTLAQSQEVTVTIARHLAVYEEFKWPYLAKPFLVRTLKLGKLQAGSHSVDWDGLDENRQPIVEIQNVRPDELDRLQLETATPEQLTKVLPVNLLQVSVTAGQERLFVNFDRAVDTLRPNRTIRSFSMSVLDREGNYLVPDFRAGTVNRYSPDWMLLDQWPKDHSRGQGYEPDECGDAGLDSRGNIFAVNGSGIYRYAIKDKGEPGPWPFQADYTRSQNKGHVLGVRTGDPEEAKKPGFAEQFSGFALDEQDNIYRGRAKPDPCIMVFNSDGRYLRSLPVPEGRRPGEIRWLGQGILALTAIGSDPEGLLYLIDSATGSVKKRIELKDNSPLKLWACQDGSFMTGHGAGIVSRFTREGEPLPFDSTLINVRGGNELRFTPHEFDQPRHAIGFPLAPKGYAIAADGSFSVSEYSDGAFVKSEVLRYSKGGVYQPETLLASLCQRTPGNIFLDAAPADFDLFVTNFSEQNQPFTMHWTLTDFDGNKSTGTAKLVAAPMCRQTLPFAIAVPERGHYRLSAEVQLGDRLVETLQAQLARIPSRDLKEDRYSPFAMCLVGEFELMKLAGVKSHRGDSASWARTVEPLEGIFYPDRPEVLQFPRGGADALRAYGRREGFLVLNGLNYGEGWLGGDWVGRPTHHLYSYDRFYQYCLRILDRFSNKGEAFYQFWNEPDNFWNPKGEFGREHFTMVQKHVWSIVKARDKNALAIADGDAGGTDMMEKFAQYDAADWNDTAQMHYPAATVYDWDNMKFPDLPETKALAIAKLVEIRDKSFPGKEVWNTEDTVPANPKTAEVTAANLPRMYLSQLAVGVDKIYQFPQTGTNSSRHDVASCIDENGHPFPTFVSLAILSRLIEGAVYAGKADFGEGTYGYLFARGQDFIFAANTISGTKEVTIDAGTPAVTLVDLMGRSKSVATQEGKLKLTLSPQVVYALLPRKSPIGLNIAKAELTRRLDQLNVADAAAISAEVSKAARAAASDKPAMNRLYHLVKAAEIAAAAGEAPVTARPTDAAKTARAAVEKREGSDGYLRSTRLALDWTERLAQQTARDSGAAWALSLAAQATRNLATNEEPVFPGVVVNAFIGEPGEIQKIRATVPEKNNPSTSIDNQFRFQINRRSGETFELELTVCNYFRHKIEGKVSPRLPEGWKANESSQSYAVEPGKFQRFVFSVEIPGNAGDGIYSVGGRTEYGGVPLQEIHASRVKL